MAKVDLQKIQELRELTGIGMMDCKKALIEANGDIEKAVELLRKKGAAIAQKRGEKATAEGLVHAYIHPGAKVGVLVEVDCETDFVARTEDLKKFAQDICMQIAAFKPNCIEPKELSPELLEKEKQIYREQLEKSGKPSQVIDKIVEGKVGKLYTELCLLHQPFIKNDKLSVQQVLDELIAKMGEKIVIRRFTRYEVGK